MNDAALVLTRENPVDFVENIATIPVFRLLQDMSTRLQLLSD